MERLDDDESATSKDRSSDNATDEDSEFVEVDPTGRYGRYAEVLGKGAYKTVYRAFDNLDGIEVAWNQVKHQDTLDKSGDVQRLYSELHLLKTLKHRNIMKFCNSWVDTRCRNVNFITEIFTSGTLRQYIKKHKNVKLKAIKHWARQILHGLVYLHNYNPPIIHRDLKCDNIFINGNSGEVKIGDLGLAAILSQAPAAHSVIGTPEFMAPELYEEHYNELVDIYSFGMCLLEMLTCEYPYSECTNAAQIYKKVTMGKKPAALDKVKDPKIRMFVETCLASASERLHARELLMDPFLRSGDDVEILERVQPMVPSHYDDLKGLYPIFRQSHVESADISSAQEQEKVHDNKEFELAEKVNVASSSNKIRGPNPSRSKVSLKRRRDFKLRARKQNDKKVLFRFCISSLAGEVRYIQFEFNLGMDTAISVANEMITELELPVGDASVIADMIDAEFMSLIPDWKPGLSLQELADVQQELPFTNAHFHEKKADDVDGSDVTTGLGVEMDDSKNDVLMHGRFEEMGCNLADFQLKQHEPDGTVCFSDFSSEQFEGGGSDLSLDASFDRLSVETRANDKSATQNLEDFGPDIKLEPSIALENPSLARSDGDSSEECFPFPAPDPKLEGDSDREEIKSLVLQQNQELQLLQSKHHQELLELKMRLNEHVKTALNELGLQEGASLQVQSELGLSMAVMWREPEALSTTCDENALDREVISEAEELPVIELAGKDSELLAESSNQLPSVMVTQSVTTDERPGNSDGLDTTFSQNGGIALHKSDCELLSVGEAEKAGCDVKQAPVAEGTEIGRLDEGEYHMKLASMGASINVPAENTTHLAYDHTSKGVNTAEQHVKSASIGAVICEAPESQVDLPSRSPVMERASSFNKRESYLQLYKSGPGQTDKLLSSKESEKYSTSDKASDPKKDNEIEQARKQQLQKSIAELEAKTLEGLSQSQNRYLAKVGGKSNAATQPGSSSSHGR